jgi:hypothetical protein
MRSALPLPRYVRRKALKGGWGYFFDVPTWARQAGCTVENEPLGSDYAAAVERAESVLLPAFDSWRSGGITDAAQTDIARPGTLDWAFAEYRPDPYEAQPRGRLPPRRRLRPERWPTAGRNAGGLDHHRRRRRSL